MYKQLAKQLSRSCVVEAFVPAMSASTSSVTASTVPHPYLKKNPWNRAITEAEKLVGFPTSYISMRSLFNDEFSNIAMHMRKLIGSDHPVLKTAKRLIFHGKNNMQVRGLLVLLLSRAAGHNGQKDFDPSTGVLERQRKLAEIVEMIHTAQCIHQSVVNIPVNTLEELDTVAREDLAQLEYGNKISILGGDYLLANACTGLAALRVTKVVEIVAIAIGEFTQSEFIGRRDSQGQPIPTKDQLTEDAWLARTKLAVGGLLASGCQGAMLLAAREDKEEVARQLGENLALAIQAHHELQLFTGDGGLSSGAPFNLATAPVMFHLQSDPGMLQYIENNADNMHQLDYRQLLDSVTSGPGIEATADLLDRQVKQAMARIDMFGDNDGTDALRKIVSTLHL